MQYDMPLYRPPSEARSLIIQAALGCSHNRCSFCSMYQGKRFRPRPPEDVLRDIQEAARTLGPGVSRVFLADGDAMCLSPRRLTQILGWLNEHLPGLQRVGIYANARDVLRKSPEELRRLRELKLGILYMGLESGDDATLEAIHKGASADQIVSAVRRAQGAGFTVSVMVLIGLGGQLRSRVHARSSAEAVTRMEPAYTALLTYTPVPGSPLFEQIRQGRFQLPGPEQSLEEIREFVANLGDFPTYFTCNHASNYLPLRGHLPGARQDLLDTLDAAIGGAIPLKPEFLRGL